MKNKRGHIPLIKYQNDQFTDIILFRLINNFEIRLNVFKLLHYISKYEVRKTLF